MAILDDACALPVSGEIRDLAVQRSNDGDSKNDNFRYGESKGLVAPYLADSFPRTAWTKCQCAGGTGDFQQVVLGQALSSSGVAHSVSAGYVPVLYGL